MHFPNPLQLLTPKRTFERLFWGVWVFFLESTATFQSSVLLFCTGSGPSAVVTSTRTRDCYPSRALLHTPSLTLPASRVFLYARIPRLVCWKELTNIVPIIPLELLLGGGGVQDKSGKESGYFGDLPLALKLLRMSLFSQGLTSYRIPGVTRLRINIRPFPLTLSLTLNASPL